MKRIATIVINPLSVSFVLRDITGEIFPFSFPASRYDTVLEVLRDAQRLRGTIDCTYIGAVWYDASLGQKIAGMSWPPFRTVEVAQNVSNHVELTNDEDATLAMLRHVQDEATAFARAEQVREEALIRKQLAS